MREPALNALSEKVAQLFAVTVGKT
jgi:hypothetical protein